MIPKRILRNTIATHLRDFPGLAFSFRGELTFLTSSQDPLSRFMRRTMRTALRREYQNFLESLVTGPGVHRLTCPLGLELSYLSLDPLLECGAGILVYHGIDLRQIAQIRTNCRTIVVRRRDKKLIERLCSELVEWTNPRMADIDSVLNDLAQRVRDDVEAYREDAFTYALSSYKDFVSSFSHEALSPIQQIRTSLEITIKNPALSDEISERLTASLQALDTLRVSLEGMRLLFKDQEKPLPNQFRSIDVRDVVRRWCEIYSQQFKAKNIEIILDPVLHEWSLKVVPEYLEVLVRNLVSNAAKYSFNASGRDAPGKFIVRYESKTGALQFVSFGVPIPEEELKRVFDYEHRATTAHDRGRVGKGVGLYLVAHIARLHGGECKASSKIVNPGYENEYARNEFQINFPKLKGGLR